ncbi:MAG TPA: glycosyltransferase family 87 protein [Chloroflexota bacterium]|nr:glycosyltransferase family 87 protein [Chloroflexota bacterium]
MEDGRAAPRPASRRLARWLVLLAFGVVVLIWLADESSMLVLLVVSPGIDFRHSWNGASLVAAGHSPYDWLAENRRPEVGDFQYPPLLALLLVPLTWFLDFPTARLVWFGFGVFCILAGLIATWRTTGLGLHGTGRRALALCLPLLPASTWALGNGQLSPELFLLIAWIYAAVAGRRAAVAGLLAAVGAYLKSFPGLLLGYFLLRRQWRGFVAAASGGLLLVALSLLVLGWEPHWTYLTRVVPAQRIWIGGPFNVSLAGFVARLFSNNGYTTPLIDADTVAPALLALSLALLVGASAYAVWRAGAASERIAYALCVVVMLLASPINGRYNLLIAALPLAVAAAAVPASRPGLWAWLVAAAVLIGLPTEFYDLWPVRYVLGTAFPVESLSALPWRTGWGILLASGSLFGLLLLAALLFRLCLAQRDPRP